MYEYHVYRAEMVVVVVALIIEKHFIRIGGAE
jgi:hypothetical protein